MSELAQIIKSRIAVHGPMRVDEYMQLCLLHPEHGYYTTREPFGTKGDFITAPEVSQMFGEVLGAALAQAWLDQGAPPNAVLAEIGPGRGTLMADILRVFRQIPAWEGEVILIEASPRLRDIQREKLGEVRHLDHVGQLPEAPVFLIANEFFDALPIRQFRRVGDGWAEVMVSCDPAGDLQFALSAPVALPHIAEEGSVREECEAAQPVVHDLASRIARHGGAAIFIDYGNWDGQGDTLQALEGGRPANPLANPGKADLTAHVDFAPLARTALAAGSAVSRMIEQGALLTHLGIGLRAEALLRAKPDEAEAIASALIRLTAPEQMGKLFKAIALWPDGAPPVAGFQGLGQDLGG